MESNNHSRIVSKSHITEKRFIAYGKASDYVKHLVNFYELQKDQMVYDESSILQKIFRKQTPINSLHKLSKMPKSNIAIELSNKIKLVNAFHNLSDKKVKKMQIKDKSSSPSPRKSRNNYFNKKNYNTLLNKLSNDLNLTESNNDSLFVTDSKQNQKINEKFEGKNRVQSRNHILNYQRDFMSGSPGSVRCYNKLITLDYNLEEESNPTQSSRLPKIKQLKPKQKKTGDSEDFTMNNRRSPVFSNPQVGFDLYPNYLSPVLKDAEVNT